MLLQFHGGLRLLIHLSCVEGVLGFGECEYRPIQWPRVSLVPRGTLQIRIRFFRQRFDPALEQTNKQLHGMLVMVGCEFDMGFQIFLHMSNSQACK